jgi:hypothetical protein
MRIRGRCSVEGCGNRHEARGLCKSHYSAARYRNQRPEVDKEPWQERFWRYVDKSRGPDECWIWTAAICDGYGRFRTGGRQYLAHRLAYELGTGEQIPADLTIDHRCHFRSCCNPRHLRIATYKQNNENKSSLQGNNTSGAQGVYWDKQCRVWRAEVVNSGIKYRLGRFDTAAAAGEAARSKRLEVFTHNELDRQEVPVP